ncbi:hypothetical protein ACYX7E_13125 [Luteimonas sp. RIT-PG2_3]
MSLLLALSASHAHAEQWLLVGIEGEQAPDRSVVYSRFRGLMTPLDMPLEAATSAGPQALFDAKMTKVMVQQVFENPSAPLAIIYEVHIHCGRREIKIVEATLFTRNSTQETSSPNVTTRIGVGWPSRVHAIACEPDKLDSALNAAAKGNTRLLADMGMVHVGELPLLTDMVTYSYANFWKETPEPPITTSLTAAELNARKQEALAFTEQMAETMKNVEKEAEFMQAIHDNFDRKSDEQKHAFAGMQGWTEDRVIGAWGAPEQAATSGETRSLVFGYTRPTYEVVQSSVDVIGARGKVGEMTQSHVHESFRNCRRHLVFRKGGKVAGWRLYDFGYDCP